MLYAKRCFVFFALLIIFVLHFHPTYVHSQVSNVPLFLTTSVDPNILFIIDDSGSMHYEVTPDEEFRLFDDGKTRFVYPRVTNLYGTGDYQSIIATFEAHIFNARARSFEINKTYYNPAKTYTPWVKADNSLYPNANPTSAFHNPENTARGYRNLTISNTNTNTGHPSINSEFYQWRRCDGPLAAQCSSQTNVVTFWPATYYWYKGGGKWDWNNYSQVEIRTTTTTYTGHGRENRTDCTNGVCTYAQEIQNFANWYTYYRSRILAARAGIGQAFVQQGANMRVGYGAINKGPTSVDNVSTSTIVQGVRPFSGAARQAFFTSLYTRDIPNLGTPLRKALDDAGQYFCRTDNRGPWGAIPGTNDTTPHITCRHSYTILMTDGYWTEGTPSQATTSGAQSNNDGTTANNMTIVNPSLSGADYTYTPANPFRDNWSNTLADVAMFYWKRDLRPTLSNKVPTSPFNPAFWQHMVTFGVGLGVTGTINPNVAWDALKNGVPIAWPNPVGSEPAKLDDLLHAAINSRGGFFSVADPDTFAKELAGVLEDIVARTESSASSIATNTTRLDTDTLVYQARFDSSDWSGQIIAYKVKPNGSPGDVAWDTDQAGKIPAHGSRKIFTWNGTTGVEFLGSNWNALSAAQRVALQRAGTEENGKKLLNWLRGSDSDEQKKGGSFRNRKKLLGDIVNSDPAYVGTANFGYDRLPDGIAGRDTYLQFRSDTLQRRRMLYVGANDGMLHAFDAETGVEQFVYIPKAVFHKLPNLSDPIYSHLYYVDGSPFVGDAYDSSTNIWKTILVGTTGAGGRSLFALDVTNPDAFNENNVLWEITNSDADFANLGYTFSQPVLARMQNGAWAVVFGNGFGVDQNAVLYIVNAFTGALIRKIDTDAGGNNGLATPALLPDGNRTINYAYAADLKGNLWKFDLTHSSTPGQWKSAFTGTGQTPAPLFTARDPAGKAQPITVPLEIIRQGVHHLILFGTGKYFEVGDDAVGGTIHSFYGILDNGTKITVVDRSHQDFSLQEQKIIHEAVREFVTPDNAVNTQIVRVVTDNPVDYATQRGWYLDLVSPVHGMQGEKVVSAALARSGRIIFTTLIPSNDPCEAGGTSWLQELSSKTGGRLGYSVYDLNNDGLFNTDDYVTITIDGVKIAVPVSGLQSKIGIIKTPAVISAGDVEYKFFGGSSGAIDSVKEKGDDMSGRQSWRQLQ